MRMRLARCHPGWRRRRSCVSSCGKSCWRMEPTLSLAYARSLHVPGVRDGAARMPREGCQVTHRGPTVLSCWSLLVRAPPFHPNTATGRRSRLLPTAGRATGAAQRGEDSSKYGAETGGRTGTNLRSVCQTERQAGGGARPCRWDDRSPVAPYLGTEPGFVSHVAGVGSGWWSGRPRRSARPVGEKARSELVALVVGVRVHAGDERAPVGELAAGVAAGEVGGLEGGKVAALVDGLSRQPDVAALVGHGGGVVAPAWAAAEGLGIFLEAVLRADAGAGDVNLAGVAAADGDVGRAGEEVRPDEREGHHGVAVFVHADGRVDDAVAVNGHVALRAGFGREGAVIHLGLDGEVGDASAAAVANGCVDAGEQLAVGEDDLVHAVIVGVDRALRQAEQIAERGVAGLLRDEARLAVGLAADDDMLQAEVRRAAVERGRVGQRPGSDAVIQRAEEVQRAQEVFGAAAGALEGAARRRGSGLDGVPDAAGIRRGDVLADVDRGDGVGDVSAGRRVHQRGLRHGVELRAVEAVLEEGELVGGDVEAIGVGADERLVAEAGAAGMAGHCAVAVGGVNAENVERASRVSGLADADEHARVAGERAGHRILAEEEGGGEE